MSSDLIVKLLFPVAEPVQMGMQMVLAITTFTGLLYNCFRTRAKKVAILKRCLLGINLAGRSLVTPGRLELPFTA